MGFSVSGSMVLVLVGLFIGLGTFYGSFSNTAEEFTAAEADQRERLDRVQGSDVAIESVRVVDSASCDVEVTATNTGESRLTVNRTDLLYDNEYRTGWRADATVDGDAVTDIWLPGETLTVTTDNLSAPPVRVKLVSGPGVADTTEVRNLGC